MNERTGISIAVLTDNQDDVELVNATLRHAGHAAHCQWVPNPSKFDAALAADSLELIMLFCERYADGIKQVVRQKDSYQPQLPVVAVAGTLDESAIETALSDGARDLVSTDNKARWLSIIDRELRAFRVERALNTAVVSANEYKRQLHTYMQRSGNAIAYVQEGIITQANSTWLTMFQVESEDDVIGMPLMDSFDSGSQAAIKGALVATIKGKWQAGEKLQVKTKLDKVTTTELELTFELVEFEDGAHVQIQIAPQAVQQEEPTKLVHDALKRDPTTLFYHREQFLERVQKRLARKPASGVHILTCIKPDNMRKVQEQVGIIASEELIAQLAELVRSRMHPHDLAGRFEGKAIMHLLERGSERDAEVWGQQLVELIHDHEFEVGDQTVFLTCTVGVCAVSGVYANFEEQVVAVFSALARGKKAGGNTVCLNDSTDEDTRLRKFDAIWVKHIRSALMENRFRLAHLPIAGLRRESTAMFDILVRMLDEQGNSVLPSEFLPAAERNNLMKTIDRWILTASIKYCREEKAQRVFVRLSSQSMKDATLVEWVQQELKRAGVGADSLCMQIPEREAAKYIKQTKSMVDRFRAIGVGFALEHFGVATDKFQILDILKPKVIKIDGELMHTLTSDTDMQEKIADVAAAADKRGIETIAERVENANAMAVLFQLGVHYMQGHYVHEPEVVLQEPVNVATTSLEAIAGN